MLLLFAPEAGHAGKRVALVVGNADYAEGSRFPDLINSSKDAVLMAETLRELGFDVIEAIDVDRGEMIDALIQFSDKVTEGSDAVFYFAGHGIEYEKRNYLITTNALFQNKLQLGEESVELQTVLGAIRDKKPAAAIVFLDCCREYPDDTWLNSGTRSLRGAGMGNVTDPDIVIAFSAKPGGFALDGSGMGLTNSPYCLALTDAMRSGEEITSVFKTVRQEVYEKTGEFQRTWETGSFVRDFFFLQPGAAPSGPDAAAQSGGYDRWSKDEIAAFSRVVTTMKGTKSLADAEFISPVFLSLIVDAEAVRYTDENGVTHRIGAQEWFMDTLFRGHIAADFPMLDAPSEAVRTKYILPPPGNGARYSLRELFPYQSSLFNIRGQLGPDEGKLPKVDEEMLEFTTGYVYWQHFLATSAYSQKHKCMLLEARLNKDLIAIELNMDFVRTYSEFPFRSVAELNEISRNDSSEYSEEAKLAMMYLTFYATYGDMFALFPPRDDIVGEWCTPFDYMELGAADREMRNRVVEPLRLLAEIGKTAGTRGAPFVAAVEAFCAYQQKYLEGVEYGKGLSNRMK